MSLYKINPSHSPTCLPASCRRKREGKVLVLMAILLPTLIAVIGLSLDGGLIMTNHRDLQNLVDVGATTGAMELRLGKSPAEARAAAIDIIQNANAKSEISVNVNIPPASGAFAGLSGYVEVIGTSTYESHLMQITNSIVSYPLENRAVAGVNDVTREAAIVVLDPEPDNLTVPSASDLLNAIDVTTLAAEAVAQTQVISTTSSEPIVGSLAASLLDTVLNNTCIAYIDQLWADAFGILKLPALPTLTAGFEIEGLGQLKVDGAVFVNNEWGGVDENESKCGKSAGPPYAVACTPLLPLTKMLVHDLRVVGGVDRSKNYRSYDLGAKNPLQANRLPVPNPFGDLLPPSAATDAANVISDLNDPADAVAMCLPTNTVVSLLDHVRSLLPALVRALFDPLVDPIIEKLTQSTLSPGVYNSITAIAPVGGVRFEPGIYIIRGVSPITNLSLTIVGPVEAEGVMFYITNSGTYDASSGLPDSGSDSTQAPPSTPMNMHPSSLVLPLLPGAKLSGLSDPSSPYNEMLIFQSSMDRRPILLQAQQLIGADDFAGTIYSKWGHVLFASAVAEYDLKFVSGTLRMITAGDMTLNPPTLTPAAQDVLLLE